MPEFYKDRVQTFLKELDGATSVANLRGAGLEGGVTQHSYYDGGLAPQRDRQYLFEAMSRYCPKLGYIWVFGAGGGRPDGRSKPAGPVVEWLQSTLLDGGGLCERDAKLFAALCSEPAVPTPVGGAAEEATVDATVAQALYDEMVAALADESNHLEIRSTDIVTRVCEFKRTVVGTGAVLDLVPQGPARSILIPTLADLCADGSARHRAVQVGHRLLRSSLSEVLHAVDVHRHSGDPVAVRVLAELLRRRESQEGWVPKLADLIEAVVLQDWHAAEGHLPGLADKGGHDVRGWVELMGAEVDAALGHSDKAHATLTALAATRRGDDYWQVRVGLALGSLLRVRGDLAEAQRTLVEALARTSGPTQGDPGWGALNARAGIALAHTHKSAGRLTAAGAILSQLIIDASGTPGLEALNGVLHSELADVYRYHGLYEKASFYLSPALELMAGCQMPEELASAHRRKAVALRETGSWSEAEGMLLEALSVLECPWPQLREEPRRRAAIVLSSLGVLYTQWGRLDEARNCFAAAWPALSPSDYDRSLLLGRIGEMYHRRGDTGRAIGLQREGLRLMRAIQRRARVADIGFRQFEAHLNLAQTLLDAGRVSASIKEAEVCYSLCVGSASLGARQARRQAQARIITARALHASRRLPELATALGEVRELLTSDATRCGVSPENTHLWAQYHLLCGRAALEARHSDDAVEQLALALDSAAAFGAIPTQQLFEAALGALGTQSSGDLQSITKGLAAACGKAAGRLAAEAEQIQHLEGVASLERRLEDLAEQRRRLGDIAGRLACLAKRLEQPSRPPLDLRDLLEAPGFPGAPT